MQNIQPALAGSAGRLAWSAPTLTEHTLLSELSVLGPKLLGLLQIGFTCPVTNPNCHVGP
jgi:hypothetical protein